MFDFAPAEQISEEDASRSCLSNDEVLDLTSGRATTERLASIRAHVERCSRCQRVVSVAKENASSGPHELHWGATFVEGDVVARRYRIQRFIARGGMGEVYDAFDRDLDERVALKTVLSTSSETFRAVRRLRAEVQLAHRVSHPNVCRIYDLGTHVLPNGSPLNFLTMEFVDGESLRARIERGPLPIEESNAIARQLLLGLAAAHAAEILHRDFKSENVMLRSAKDASPSAVIMDFGLASPMDANAALFMSGANALVGTPCYMSPEQLEGAQLCAASDVYSFGVVWFEMLTGRLPFSLRTPFDRLRRPAPRAARLNRDVPPRLDAIIDKCLARNRSARFSSAEEVLAALDAMSARVSTTTAPPRPARPFALAAAATLACSLLGWAALKGHGATRPIVTPAAAGARARNEHDVAPRSSSPSTPASESATPRPDDPGSTAVPLPPLVAPGAHAAPFARRVDRVRARGTPTGRATASAAAPTSSPDSSPSSRETTSVLPGAGPTEATTEVAAQDPLAPEAAPASAAPDRDVVTDPVKSAPPAGEPRTDAVGAPAEERARAERGFLNPFRGLR